MATVAAVQSLGRTDWTDSVFCKIEVRSLPRPHYHYPVVWWFGWVGGVETEAVPLSFSPPFVCPLSRFSLLAKMVAASASPTLHTLSLSLSQEREKERERESTQLGGGKRGREGRKE